VGASKRFTPTGGSYSRRREKISRDQPERGAHLADIISHAVRLYYVFSLRLRDGQLLLAERGVIFS